MPNALLCVTRYNSYKTKIHSIKYKIIIFTLPKVVKTVKNINREAKEHEIKAAFFIERIHSSREDVVDFHITYTVTAEKYPSDGAAAE